MFNNQDDKLRLIQPGLLIAGIDVAKHDHCVQPTYYNGILIGKPFKFNNSKDGFESLLSKLERIKLESGCTRIIVGLEPTGHYWKALTWFLRQNNIQVVLVNPYHVKQSKELDDNTQTKSDPKDSKIIARLIRDGRFSQLYTPEGVYAELRVLTNVRTQLINRSNAVMNILTAILDEYFPEYTTVFKDITGKASLQILYNYPFPRDIKRLGVPRIITEFKKVVKRTVGRKRAELLYNTACNSIGVPANEATRLKIQLFLDELKGITEKIAKVETEMTVQLKATGFAELILSIPGIGIVIAAGILGQIGDPSRFTNWKQIRKFAGFNLVEDSSGKRIGQHVISKRGRAALRSILYQAVLVMVAKNNEFKRLYKYLISRKQNPLKRKQALIAIANKLIRVILTLISNREIYAPNKVLGSYRENQLKVA